MSSNDEPSRMEVFKAFSTFFSSVILASASIVVTLKYNQQQLEIAQKQAVSQMEITRIKEISDLIPKLGSENDNERKFSAITLSLYGESAVPALIALLEDENSTIREVSSKALTLIGEPAIPELESAFKDERNSENLRALSIYTLGGLKSEKAVQIATNAAIKAVQDSKENKIVRKDAATALGKLKDARSIPVLLEAMQSKTNSELVENSIWALGEIRVKDVNKELVSMLNHNNVRVRVATVWALAKLKDENTGSILLNVAEKDLDQDVRDAATNAIEWMK